MPLDLRKVRYFVAIGDAGALSHAASALNVSQSALSHDVAELEADLGVRLIEHHARGIRLTAAGRRLCEHGRAILAAFRVEDDVRTFATETIGLRVTYVLAAGPQSISLAGGATSFRR